MNRFKTFVCLAGIALCISISCWMSFLTYFSSYAWYSDYQGELPSYTFLCIILSIVVIGIFYCWMQGPLKERLETICRISLVGLAPCILISILMLYTCYTDCHVRGVNLPLVILPVIFTVMFMGAFYRLNKNAIRKWLLSLKELRKQKNNAPHSVGRRRDVAQVRAVKPVIPERPRTTNLAVALTVVAIVLGLVLSYDELSKNVSRTWLISTQILCMAAIAGLMFLAWSGVREGRTLFSSAIAIAVTPVSMFVYRALEVDVLIAYVALIQIALLVISLILINIPDADRWYRRVDGRTDKKVLNRPRLITAAAGVNLSALVVGLVIVFIELMGEHQNVGLITILLCGMAFISILMFLSWQGVWWGRLMYSIAVGAAITPASMMTLHAFKIDAWNGYAMLVQFLLLGLSVQLLNSPRSDMWFVKFRTEKASLRA